MVQGLFVVVCTLALRLKMRYTGCRDRRIEEAYNPPTAFNSFRKFLPQSENTILNHAIIGPTSQAPPPQEPPKMAEEPKPTYEDLCLGKFLLGRYQHSPLHEEKKEIRLIKVLTRDIMEDRLFTQEAIPKCEEDDEFRLSNERTFVIKASIEHHPLESAPPYIALSYTWGSPDEPKRPVFVQENPNDPQDERFHLIEVSENLFQALRQVTPRDDIVHIWADAICINQADNQEKSWQVKQMWEIYQKARYVYMWLGRGVAITNSLMDMMQSTISEQFEQLSGGNQAVTPDRFRVPDNFYMLDEFQKLAENGYWTRAWIRQEISSHEADSIVVVYGRCMIHFHVLLVFHTAVKNSAQEIHQIPTILRTPHQEAIMRLASSTAFRTMSDALGSSLGGEKARLVHILYNWVRKIYLWGDGLQASDPRDLIYSLFWMTNWRDDKPIRPDYTVSAREVYIGVAKRWPNLCTWRSDPVSAVTPREDLNLPSWVPDWRRPIRPAHLIKLPPWEGCNDVQYSAGSILAYKGGETIRPLRFVDDGGDGRSYVHMEGFVLDVIADTGPTMRRDSRVSTQEMCRKFIAALDVLGVSSGDVGADSLAQDLSDLSLSPVLRTHGITADRARWQLPILNVGVENGWLKQAPTSYEAAYEFFSNPPPKDPLPINTPTPPPALLPITTNGHGSTSRSPSPIPPSTTTPAAHPPKPSSRLRAMINHIPSEPDELEFTRGDIITFISPVYKNWWKGSLKGKTGTFPKSHVEVLPDLSPEELQQLDTTISRYADICVAACESKRFFATKGGFLGLAFPNVCAGDLVVVFPGLKVSLVLRRDGGGRGYRIVSDAYVQGVMEGELHQAMRDGEFQLKDFGIY